jgi:hypothetical protein
MTLHYGVVSLDYDEKELKNVAKNRNNNVEVVSAPP